MRPTIASTLRSQYVHPRALGIGVLLMTLAACQTAPPAPAALPNPTSAPTSAAPTTVASPTSVPTRAAPASTPAPPTAAPKSAAGPATASATAMPKAGQAAVPVAGLPAVRLTESLRDLTAGFFFDPFPVQLGSSTTFGVVLTNAAGQPIPDAAIEMSLTGGMAGMEGEHDEDFHVKLVAQGSGVYLARESLGSQDLVPTGLSVRITRGAEVWSFNLSKDQLTKP